MAAVHVDGQDEGNRIVAFIYVEVLVHLLVSVHDVLSLLITQVSGLLQLVVQLSIELSELIFIDSDLSVE